MSEAIEINNPMVSKIMPRVVDIKNAKIMHQNHLVLDNHHPPHLFLIHPAITGVSN